MASASVSWSVSSNAGSDNRPAALRRSIARSTFDQAVFWVSTAPTTTSKADSAGHQGWSDQIPGDDWTDVTVPITDTFFTDEFRIRFLFGSDRGVTDEGWFVDDVQIAVD